ncbi:YidH family protein [Vibrio maritimus]|uniref:YidH family protein n=1 Tax=Vibrio maritimus TaxID=990268 RepID=UPI004068947D
MMKKLKNTNHHSWRDHGEAPDYRFSLANERTYLAWIRTSLASLAGAIALDQLTPGLASPLVRVLISSFLCLCAGLLAVFAYRRWADNEKAMRNKAQLRYTSFLKVISGTMLLLTVTVILAITL